MKPATRATLTDLFESFVVVSGAPFLPSLLWIDGRHKGNIRMDRNRHLQSGERHFHIYGKPRRGSKGKLVVVVKEDGSRSHGQGQIELHQDDADALRTMGVPIPPSNIVYWMDLDDDLVGMAISETGSSPVPDSSPTP